MSHKFSYIIHIDCNCGTQSDWELISFNCVSQGILAGRARRLEIALLDITVDTRIWILGKLEYPMMSFCFFYCCRRYCYRASYTVIA